MTNKVIQIKKSSFEREFGKKSKWYCRLKEDKDFDPDSDCTEWLCDGYIDGCETKVAKKVNRKNPIFVLSYVSSSETLDISKLLGEQITHCAGKDFYYCCSLDCVSKIAARFVASGYNIIHK